MFSNGYISIVSLNFFYRKVLVGGAEVDVGCGNSFGGTNGNMLTHIFRGLLVCARLLIRLDI